jgi:hypothetical protein
MVLGGKKEQTEHSSNPELGFVRFNGLSYSEFKSIKNGWMTGFAQGGRASCTPSSPKQKFIFYINYFSSIESLFWLLLVLASSHSPNILFGYATHALRPSRLATSGFLPSDRLLRSLVGAWKRLAKRSFESRTRFCKV